MFTEKKNILSIINLKKRFNMNIVKFYNIAVDIRNRHSLNSVGLMNTIYRMFLRISHDCAAFNIRHLVERLKLYVC